MSEISLDEFVVDCCHDVFYNKSFWSKPADVQSNMIAQFLSSVFSHVKACDYCVTLNGSSYIAASMDGACDIAREYKESRQLMDAVYDHKNKLFVVVRPKLVSILREVKRYLQLNDSTYPWITNMTSKHDAVAFAHSVFYAALTDVYTTSYTKSKISNTDAACYYPFSKIVEIVNSGEDNPVRVTLGTLIVYDSPEALKKLFGLFDEEKRKATLQRDDWVLVQKLHLSKDVVNTINTYEDYIKVAKELIK